MPAWIIILFPAENSTTSTGVSFRQVRYSGMSPKSYKNDSPEKPIFMNFISEDLLHYCEKHSSPESDLLHTLNRETHLKASSPRMLSGHLQGRLLAMLSSLFNPRRILEIGTYTGYSALCLAEGLTPD